MAKSNPNLTDIFTDVANSIRAKKGTSEDIYPVDFADEIATITGGGDQPQLHAPTISRQTGSRTLNILDTVDNGDFATGYGIYDSGTKIGTANGSTFDLTQYVSEHARHVITAKCEGTNFLDSVASNESVYDSSELHAPTISASGSILTISNPDSNEDFVDSYDIYVDGASVGNVSATTVDLHTYLSVNGTYAIKVRANGTGFNSVFSNEIQYVFSTVDPILENNSWSVIRDVCENGQAANYWSLGDSKNVTASGYTRPVKLVHVGSIYGNKHAVFEFWNRTENNCGWDTGNSNDVTTADIWAQLEPTGGAYQELIDAELGIELTDTTVQVATSGTDGTLTTLTGKLFLPAEKELTATMRESRTEEFNALTTFGYHAANDNNATRVKHKASTSGASSGDVYWLRSPYNGSSYFVVSVYGNGGFDYNGANFNTNNGIAPCFAF